MAGRGPARLAVPLASLGDHCLAGLRATGVSEELALSHQDDMAASWQAPSSTSPSGWPAHLQPEGTAPDHESGHVTCH